MAIKLNAIEQVTDKINLRLKMIFPINKYKGDVKKKSEICSTIQAG